MRLLLLFVALSWPAFVLPQDKLIPLHVYEDEKTTIHLNSAPCSEEILKLIVPEKRPLYKNALESTFTMGDGSRQSFPGCWREMVDSYYTIFSDGDGYILPKDIFDKPVGSSGI